MSQELLPVLAQREEMRIVEVDGQPVVTARDLARALEYKNERAVTTIYYRNKDSFKESDVMVLNLSTIQGERETVVLTKRGALKVCMKSNQPRAVAVQEALIDLYEQVERGQLVSAGYLQDVVRELKSEVSRLSRLAAGAGSGQGAQPVQVVYIPRRRKPHSIDDAALSFLQGLFNRKPWAKVVELDRCLRAEAAEQGWRVGSRDSVYRVVRSWKNAASSLIH